MGELLCKRLLAVDLGFDARPCPNRCTLGTLAVPRHFAG